MSAAVRKASLRRDTAETKIALEVNLDGTGASEIATGVAFFDYLFPNNRRFARRRFRRRGFRGGRALSGLVFGFLFFFRHDRQGSPLNACQSTDIGPTRVGTNCYFSEI